MPAAAIEDIPWQAKFMVIAPQAWLGPSYRTICDYFYVKQLTTIEPN